MIRVCTCGCDREFEVPKNDPDRTFFTSQCARRINAQAGFSGPPRPETARRLNALLGLIADHGLYAESGLSGSGKRRS